MNEPTNILDEVIGELSAIPTIKPDTSMPAKEPPETLEQLTNAWKNEKMKLTSMPKPTAPRFSSAPTFPTNRPKYDESAKPFLKKEELYPYWQSGAVTTPYIIVAIENLFEVPHELWRQIESEICSQTSIPTKLSPMERLERELDFFNRVLSTASMKRKSINPQFVSDYGQARDNRLFALSSLRHNEEMSVFKQEEQDRRNFYKRNRFSCNRAN